MFANDVVAEGVLPNILFSVSSPILKQKTSFVLE
jgi:hypothetical protein